MQTKLSVFCDKVIEAGWLVALIVVPLFFNIYSQRVFEPDKLFLLRAISLLIVTAWVIRFIDSGAIRSNSEFEKMQGANLKKWIFNMPLVLPTLLLAGIYLLSTLFSITPGISLWGSYTRLQGTVTMFSYLIVFFSILGLMRKREQVNLLWIILILTSVPISIYGLLQHLHLDPIQWGGERAASVPSRVVSTMGNPIFLGAYLIMVIPVTLARIVETFLVFLDRKQRAISSLLIIFLYVFIMGLQLLCLLFTQSRGPFLGLLGGLYFFIFLSLLYLRRKDANQGCLNRHEIIKAFVFTALSIPVGVIPAYLFLTFLKRGFRWLWFSWLIHAVLTGAILVLLVLPHPSFSSFQKFPFLGRLVQLSDTETGSVKVRMLIWKGTIELLKADPLRAVIGYGPESIQTIYPRYYPPALAQHAYRSSPVDRSHNETFDVFVTTGLLGLGVYIFFIAGIFHFGLRWLGFLLTKRDHLVLLLFMTIGGITGVVLPRWIEGTYRLSGLGLPLGLISGAIFCLILSGMISTQKAVALKKPWLLIGLFSALVAHLIEIQFGIAVAVTQFYFWIYLGIFVLMGLNWVGESSDAEQPESRSSAGDSSSQPYAGVVAGSFLMATVLFTLGLDFINNPKLEQSWLKVIQISLTTLGAPGSFQSSYGVLLMFLLTWLIGGFAVISENRHQNFLNQRKEGKEGWTFVSGIYIYVTLLIFFIGIIIHARNIRPAMDPSNTIIFYFIGVVILIFLIAWSLSLNLSLPVRPRRKFVFLIYPVMILIIGFIIFSTYINPIRADIYFKQGQVLKDRKDIDPAIQFHRRAIDLEPEQDIYHLGLSQTLMIKAGMQSDSNAKNVLFEECFKSLERARQINPLDSKTYSLLGYLFHKWGEMDSNPEGKREKLNRSHDYYKQAANYTPHNILTYHLWARTFLTQGNFEGAVEKLKFSLSLDPRFAPTYFNLGEIYAAQGKLEEAKDFFLEALRIDPNQPIVRSTLGLIYLKSGQLELAIEQNLEVLQLLPNDFRSHNNLALIYQKMGRIEEAMTHAQKALALSPESDRPAIQTFIDRLKTKRLPDKLK